MCAVRARCASICWSGWRISSAPLLGLAARCGQSGARRPRGATGDGGFKAMPEMMSILGCSPDELGNVLKALGFGPSAVR